MQGVYPLPFGYPKSLRYMYISMQSFPYSGKVVSWSYYVAEADAWLFVGIWRSVGNSGFTLLEKVQLPTGSLGYHNFTVPTAMEFRIGDFFGVHTKTGSKLGLSFCNPDSEYPTCKCDDVFQRYVIADIQDESLPVGGSVTLNTDKVAAFAIMANIEP